MLAQKIDEEGRAFTEQDYWSLPEGRRAELVDGELFDMAPPSRTHQRIVLKLSRAFDELADREGCPCEVYPAPFGVNVRGDGTAWVEPDVVVVCDPEKLSDRGCEGAPDLIVEVVSPSSQRRDYLTKAALYAEAGVREYWIVDPSIGQTAVYRYERGDVLPAAYPFDAAVPVGIAEGEGPGEGDAAEGRGPAAPTITLAELLA